MFDDPVLRQLVGPVRQVLPHEIFGEGEQTRLIVIDTYAHGSSPRGRGTDRRRPAECRHARFIPAWAGNRPTGRT